MIESSTIIKLLDFQDCESVLSLIKKNLDYFEKGTLGNLPMSERAYQLWLPKDDSERPNEKIYGVFQNNACIGMIGTQLCRVGSMKEHAMASWYAFDEIVKKTGVATASILKVLTEAATINSSDEILLCLHIHKSNKRSVKMALRLGYSPNLAMDYSRYNGSRSSTKYEGYSISKSDFLMRSKNSPYDGTQSKRRLSIK